MSKYGSWFSKCLQPINEIAVCFRLRFQDLFHFLAIAYATGPRYPVASWYMAHLHSISALPRKTACDLKRCCCMNVKIGTKLVRSVCYRSVKSFLETHHVPFYNNYQRLMLVVFSSHFHQFGNTFQAAVRWTCCLCFFPRKSINSGSLWWPCLRHHPGNRSLLDKASTRKHPIYWRIRVNKHLCMFHWVPIFIMANLACIPRFVSSYLVPPDFSGAQRKSLKGPF